MNAYLESLKDEKREFVWIGWPGTDPPEAEKPALAARLGEEYGAHPVFVSEQVMNNFYGGFCNETIWPLFHYFPTYASFDDEYWEDYKKVNQLYCDAVLEVVQDGDVVWVHDYQLMLLPHSVRAALPDAAHRVLPPHPVPVLRGLPPAAAAGAAPSSTACSAPT